MEWDCALFMYSFYASKMHLYFSWFQAFTVFCMLCAFFWVITQKKAYNICILLKISFLASFVYKVVLYFYN